MRRFKWIEWKLQKIDDHGLTPEDVESAFNRAFGIRERRDGSFKMLAETPSGRLIWVIWRYDREREDNSNLLGELSEAAIFVVTAY